MQLDILSIFIIVSLAQGIFVLFMLWRMESPSKYSSVFLALVVLSFVWYQTEFLLIRNKAEFDFYLLFGTRFGSWLLIGPVLWFYLRSYFDQNFKVGARLALHFLPFILLTVLIPSIYPNVLTWRSVDYGMLTVFDGWDKKPISFVQYLYGAVFVVQFLHALGYIIAGLLFIQSLEGKLKNQYSNFDQINIVWHKRFLWAAVFIIVLTFGFVLFQFITEEYRRAADYFYVVPMTGATYLLLFHAIKYPNLIFQHDVTSVSEKYKKSSLPPEVSKAYAHQATVLIEQEELYRNRELRLRDLADELNISTHYLSQSINENFKKNFFEMINNYRVKAAKNSISYSPEKSLLQIGFEVGFNNKASFNNAFKKYAGMTPSRYRKYEMGAFDLE